MGIAQDLIFRVTNPDGNPAGSSGRTNLPTVSDPGGTLARISRSQYDDFINNFGDFETMLLDRAQNDTSIVDQARADAPIATRLSREIGQRNISRYGAALDPAQARELERSSKRTGALGTANAINNAQIDQDTVNTALASRLIDIGQGVQAGANSGLQSAAANQSALNNAYRDARTASRNNTLSTIGGLGSMAIIATGF